MSAEEIQLESTAGSLAVEELPKHIPDSAARYHLYRYDHNYEGDFYHSVCECLTLFSFQSKGDSCSSPHANHPLNLCSALKQDIFSINMPFFILMLAFGNIAALTVLVRLRS